MLRKIKLYGPLRKLSGVEEFEADVSNVDQVFSFIKVNYPDTKQHLTESFYSVHMNDLDITFKNLVIKGEGDLKVIPIISGNFIDIFLGTLFAGFINTTVSNTAALLTALATTALAFVADLLAPVPIEPGTDPQEESFLTNQNANTTKAGGPAPLVFGECLVGSIVISAGADTVQVADEVST
ncbi:MAG: hypothetical protein CMA63_03285 [Euryarchaeota archaeon]|nr:hypothetical protein [Euryarchaeota archaeon]